MDHLTLSENSCEYFEVPYLQDPTESFVYDNGSYMEFLNRMGWSWEQIKSIGKKTEPVDNDQANGVASLLQAWLYFGLIHVVTRLPVVTGHYVRRNPTGRLIVTSKPLLGHLKQWQDTLANLDDQGRSQIASIDQFLKIHQYFLTNVVVIWKPLLPYEVRASIVILHQTLVLAKLSMFPDSRVHACLCGFHTDLHREIQGPLNKNGWCRAVVQRLAQRLSTPTLYVMASLSLQHVLPAKSELHARCSDTECRVSPTLVTAFKPQHVDPDCECQLITSIEQQIISVVERRCIPLLAFSTADGLSIKSLDMASTDTKKLFIAISHVWADGLGNPLDNTMYPCQIKLLQHRVNEIAQKHPRYDGSALEDEDALFWIDTLCVPAKESEIKSIAIATMENVYRTADIVLVIDAGLTSLPVMTTSPFRLAISIAASKWWTRLWTLQECAFAKALYFQFKDDAISPAEVIQLSRQHFSSTSDSSTFDIQSELVRDALSEADGLSLSKLRSNSGRHVFQQVFWRFTSREADETICLAIILGLPVSDLSRLDADPLMRMKALILKQKSFPFSVMFGRVAYVPHLEDDGFRWVPRTFLGRTTSLSGFESQFSDRFYHQSTLPADTTYADEQGLHISALGFQLDMRGPTTESIFMSAAPNSNIECRILDGPQRGLYKLSLMGRSAQTWLFIHRLPRPLFLILPRPLDAGTRGIFGVLVSGLGDAASREGEIPCRYESRMAVYLHERFTNETLHADSLRHPEEASTVGAVGLDYEQKWCVR